MQIELMKQERVKDQERIKALETQVKLQQDQINQLVEQIHRHLVYDNKIYCCSCILYEKDKVKDKDKNKNKF